jgi:hypothetical protein
VLPHGTQPKQLPSDVTAKMDGLMRKSPELPWVLAVAAILEDVSEQLLPKV